MGCSSSKPDNVAKPEKATAEATPAPEGNSESADVEMAANPTSDEPTAESSPTPVSNVKPFSNTAEDDGPVHTAPEESQADNPAAANAAPIEGLSLDEEEPVEVTTPTLVVDAAAAEAELGEKPEMVKRTSVKDRIKRVNSMERRSVSSRFSTDSPLNSQKAEFDFMFKFALMGDLAVGKSSLQNQFVSNAYASWYKSTVGMEFKFKTIDTIEGEKKKVRIQLWDTSGKERLQGASKEFFSKILGFALVYDVTNPESFESVKTWCKKTQLPEGTAHAPLVVRMLIANKVEDEYDEGVERKITTEQGVALAEELGCMFYEVSAKTGFQVSEAFQMLSQAIVNKIEDDYEGRYEEYKKSLY